MADNREIEGGGVGGLFISLTAMHAFEIRVISWHVNSRPSSWLPDSQAITHFPLIIADVSVCVCLCVCVCVYVHAYIG